MKISEIDKLSGKYCRVISKVPEDSGLEGVFYDFGTVENIDLENNLVSIKTKHGSRLLKEDEIYDIVCMDEFTSTKFE